MRMEYLLLADDLNVYTNKRILEEFRKNNSPCHGLSVKDLSYFSSDVKQNTVLINRCSGFSYDDLDVTFSRLAHRVFPCLKALENLRGKEKQVLELLALDLPVIEGLFIRGRLDESLIEKIVSKNWNQFVLKPQRGCKGVGVNFVPNLNALKDLLETFWAIKDQKFIVQPFINFQSEIRIYGLGNRILDIIEKRNHEGLKNNISAGAVWKKVTHIPPEIEKMASKILENFRFSLVAIDIGIDTAQNAIIMEVNLNPGVEHYEDLTKNNLIGPMVSAILKGEV